MNRIVKTLINIIILQFFAIAGLAQDRVARIGVLAFRGADATMQEWHPLAQYLTQNITGWEFDIVPVTLVSASDTIKMKNLDFLITNPGHFVTLALEFGLTPLATREISRNTGGLTRYGTVIFVRADSGINTLDDLRDQSVAAVSPEAFGGFQLAWRQFTVQGIDPFTDFAALRFMGFPQDAIVTAVSDGSVDAGIIRSGLLEQLAKESGLILDDFVVLQNNSQLDYPDMISGELVPEWPFLALSGIDKQLREQVAIALLATQTDGFVGMAQLWTAPLSYEGVREMINAYHARKTGTLVWVFVLVGIVGVALLATLIWSKSKKPDETSAIKDQKQEDSETALLRHRFETLTKREREVLEHICEGRSSREIAATLGVGLKTIEYHRANLLQKSRAGTTAHLVQLATRFGYDLG